MSNPAQPGSGFSARTLGWVRAVVMVALAASVVAAVLGTLHWPIVGDAPIFHYISFLMDHGLAPYRQIVDINLPGTYALEWSAIHVIGPGAAAWRAFDLGLVAAGAAAMVVVARRTDWLAGMFAGALFALIHLRDGPTHTGQRDLMMTTMLLLAVAALFECSGPRRVWMAAVFGFFAGFAAIIKPSGVLFAVALLVLLGVRLRQREEPRAGAVVAAVMGLCVPVLACVGWLMHHQALGAFVAINRTLVPYHASLGRPSFAALVVGSFPSVLLAVALPALPLLVSARRPWRWEGLTVLVCAGLGCVSYIAQGKGFPYHRYPTEAFVLLGCALLLFPALKQSGWPRYAALAGVLLGAVYLGPASAAIARHYDGGNQEFNVALAGDLGRLGTAGELQKQVQCVDMTAGCLDTLYNLRIVQATGFLYDCYLFQPEQTAVSLQYREEFWEALTAARPRVLVVTDQQCFAMTRDWTQPARWPQFEALLADDYRLVHQYTPPHLVAWWRKPAVPYSYRLYVRKDAASSTPN